MEKVKIIWDITTQLLEKYGENVEGISIHENSEDGEIQRKIYCSLGYCFELSKEQVPHDGLTSENGYIYSFCEPWDGFKKAGIDKAIEILKSIL